MTEKKRKMKGWERRDIDLWKAQVYFLCGRSLRDAASMSKVPTSTLAKLLSNQGSEARRSHLETKVAELIALHRKAPVGFQEFIGGELERSKRKSALNAMAFIQFMRDKDQPPRECAARARCGPEKGPRRPRKRSSI
jgi:predicted component of type VI protein secretion system